MVKDNNILLRVSEEEKNSFNRAASLSGLSLSAWTRERLREVCNNELKKFNETPEFLKPPKKKK